MMSTNEDPTVDKAVVQVAGPDLAPAQDTEKEAAGGGDNAEGASQTPPKENVTEKPPAPSDNKAAHGKSSGMRRKQIEAHAVPAERLDLSCLDWHEPGPVPLPAAVLPDWLNRLFGSASGSPAFVCSVMAACSAAIGNAVSLPAMAGAAAATGSLRVAVVTDDRTLPSEVTAVLEPAYAIERQEVNAWAPLAQANELQRGLLARRRRLVMTTVSNAGLLGLGGLETRIDAYPEPAPPRPQFVLRDVRPAALSKAVEASRGLLVVADGKVPTLSGFATNYDSVTADVLNKAAAGEKLEIADVSGGVTMRTVNICAIGVLTPADTLSLHKATPDAMAATIFVPPSPGRVFFGPGTIKALTNLLGRLRTIGVDGDALKLTFSIEAQKSAAAMRWRFERAAATHLPPLSYFYASLGDLAARLAAVLHLIKHALGSESKVDNQIEIDELLCAINLIEGYIKPAAVSVLSAASVDPIVRHGRRVLSFAQQRASAQNPSVVRRDVVRWSQGFAAAVDIDAALARLRADGLVSYVDRAPSFDVHPLVFDPARRLPDLVTDPRKRA